MSDDLFNYNDADKQSNYELAPPGKYRLRVTVRPGSIEDDHLVPAKNGYTHHLALKYTIQGGEYDGTQLFDYITLKHSPNGRDLEGYELGPASPQKVEGFQTAVRLGRAKLRALLESAHAINPNDNSAEANAKRRVKDNDFLNLDGLEFWAHVDIRKGRDGYRDSNTIDFIITPDLPDWPTATQNAIVPRSQEFNDEIPY